LIEDFSEIYVKKTHKATRSECPCCNKGGGGGDREAERRTMATEMEELVSFLSSPSPQVNPLTLVFDFTLPSQTPSYGFSCVAALWFLLSDHQSRRRHSSRLNRFRRRLAVPRKLLKLPPTRVVSPHNASQGNSRARALCYLC